MKLLWSVGWWTPAQVCYCSSKPIKPDITSVYDCAVTYSLFVQVIIRAPLSDLQRDPTSELLKRFSQDVVQSDDLLPVTAFDMIMVSCVVGGAFCYL